MNKITSNDTRDIILDVTEKLIYKSGIAATGMDLLVKTAGVSRKSVYRYFANKDELVVAALQRRDQRWMHWYRGAVGQAQTPAERLLNLFTVLKSWFACEGFPRLRLHQHQRRNRRPARPGAPGRQRT